MSVPFFINSHHYTKVQSDGHRILTLFQLINQPYLFCFKNRNNNTQYVTECRQGGLRSDLPVFKSSSHLKFRAITSHSQISERLSKMILMHSTVH